MERVRSRRGMVAGAVALAASASVFMLAATSEAQASCVRAAPGCYQSLAEAVEAAHKGETIHVGKGTFAGGVTITKSVRIVGSGRTETVVSGGGPVLEIGTWLGSHPPTVSIERLTVTGGLTTHGQAGPASARGGGIFIPPLKGFRTGATVLLNHVSVSGNRAEPSTTRGPESKREERSWPRCPEGFCPFAIAEGAGIDNWGDLTISDSVISDNHAGGIASDADGAGIASLTGQLTLTGSQVTGNEAVASVPNGRFAEGGGIFAGFGGAITISGSSISDNVASMKSELPSFAGESLIEMNANSGGIHVGGGIALSIEASRIDRNTVIAQDPNGEPNALDAAMLDEGPLSKVSSTDVSGNEMHVTTATTAEPVGSTLEFDGGGEVSGLRLTNNATSVHAVEGQASAAGALAVFNFESEPPLLTLRDSLIANNTLEVTSDAGPANAQGAGVFNNSLLELQGVLVRHNSAIADGPSGSAQGGGIWNGVEISGPPVELTLKGSTVTQNRVSGSAAVELAGGGLFTTLPVTLEQSTLERNHPEDCAGC